MSNPSLFKTPEEMTKYKSCGRTLLDTGMIDITIHTKCGAIHHDLIPKEWDNEDSDSEIFAFVRGKYPDFTLWVI